VAVNVFALTDRAEPSEGHKDVWPESLERVLQPMSLDLDRRRRKVPECAPCRQRLTPRLARPNGDGGSDFFWESGL
jgi:hypothetical protein